MSYYARMLAGATTACLVALTATTTIAIAQGNGALASSETASTDKARASTPGPTPRVLLLTQHDGLAEDIVVHEGTATTWYFPDRIASYVVGNEADYPPVLDDQRKRLVIQPKSRPSPTNLNVETTVRMAFHLVPARPGQAAVEMVILLPPDAEPSKTSTPRSPTDPRERAKATARDMAQHWEVRPPRTAVFALAGYQITARVTAQVIEGVVLKYRVHFRNRGKPFPLQALQVLPHGQASDPVAAVIDWEGGAMPSEIAEGDDIAATVIVPNAGAVTERMALRLVPSRLNVYPATFSSWEEEETPPNKGRRVVQLEAFGGAINLPKPGDATEKDFTLLRGLGARAAYGVTGSLSVDASVALLSTSDAVFADASTAHATTGRAILGGMFQFGEKYVPYARIGLGGRLSHYVPAPGKSEYRGGTLVTLGAGLDAWLGTSFVAGIAANLVSPLGGDDESYSFELGLHVGYAWKPWYL